MESIKNRLIEKGWSKKDINKTLKIIETAKTNIHPKIKILDKSIYWISLIVTIIGNILLSFLLIPLLLVLKSFYLYFVVATIAISFGLLFELLIRSMEHLETKHHFFLSLLIPSILVINVIIIVSMSNKFNGTITIQNTNNPLIIGIVYAIFFMLPYLVYNYFLKNSRKTFIR
tara:strand:+ start:842 stop:1360 length:519 start_codon:yes stop_codon:yes gene_type:complete